MPRFKKGAQVVVTKTLPGISGFVVNVVSPNFQIQMMHRQGMDVMGLMSRVNEWCEAENISVEEFFEKQTLYYIKFDREKFVYPKMLTSGPMMQEEIDKLKQNTYLTYEDDLEDFTTYWIDLSYEIYPNVVEPSGSAG